MKTCICLAADKKYLKYAYVLIYSIINNYTNNDKLYIYILTPEINNQELIDDISDLSKINNCNINIIFKDISYIAHKYNINSLYTSRHITSAAYYRLLIPEIFKDYDKVLYLDIDTICLDNIGELLAYDLGSCTLGVVPDVARVRFDNDFIKYINQELKIDYADYFCSGVLLYDIKNCLDFNFTDKVFAFFERVKEPIYYDQDCLNSILYKTTCHIPYEWHVQAFFYGKHRIQEILSKKRELLKSYYMLLESYKHPKLVHFQGAGTKPWSRPQYYYADKWWDAVKQSPKGSKYFKLKIDKIKVTEIL